MDLDKRLESHYQAAHLRPIDRHYSPEGHQEYNDLGSPDGRASRFKPGFAAGARNLVLETDNAEYQRAQDNPEYEQQESGLPRHHSVAPLPNGPSMGMGPIDRGVHLNKSRRRILNDYVRPQNVLSTNGSQVLGNKNLHQGLTAPGNLL